MISSNVITALHLAFLATAIVGIVLADASAFKWTRGHEDPRHREKIFRIHWMVTIGLSGLVLSGLYLFWPLRDYLLTQPLFWLKMFFVAALLVNSFFVEQFMHVATTRAYSSLTPRERTPLYISGAISTLCWVGAITVAILIFKWPFV